MGDTERTDVVLAEVAAERARQDEKWGAVQHLALADGTGPDRGWFPGALIRADHIRDVLQERTDRAAQQGDVTFLDIALEEVAEAFAEEDEEALRREVIQCAAVFVKWAEALDHRAAAAAERAEVAGV